ncbi:hypothetical protein J2Z21_005962 [Streptomyces griseochromogenes]|uniref:Uncharacterized protein n=1 Tax=Streptomyces griseochromogenes TaxID=68214 RepID=A0A1B1APA4_9ACTN|nr:hypothetical protein [Streptomyces griseochromogenes]ANP48374.1 hypothetical protein AVL59_01230 [Streptomyces griseochromogenes]MBP2052973.1 hypothetical protein [Streptomyces griseochromogenes]
MTVSIIHALLRWALGLFVPGTGRRRAESRPAAVPAPAHRPEAPRTAAPWPPTHRSPYGLDTPLDGSANAIVRPYLLEDERERAARQSRRRLALVLAADFGIDIDQHVVGAEAVA